ncbi:hypothetical protein AGMMS50249_1050 [candidate division SR1 bacterium]|nr:hypothetical protein AGMMS50249_1050 [candidate division SR1 bacterium]
MEKSIATLCLFMLKITKGFKNVYNGVCFLIFIRLNVEYGKIQGNSSKIGE